MPPSLEGYKHGDAWEIPHLSETVFCSFIGVGEHTENFQRHVLMIVSSSVNIGKATTVNLPTAALMESNPFKEQ